MLPSSIFAPKDVFTQTREASKTMNTSTQTNVFFEDRETQINMKILKRECVPRNSEEELLISLSNEPLAKYIATLNELKIPREAALKFERGNLQQILDEQMTALNHRSYEIFEIMTFKEFVYREDYESANLYFQSTYPMFLEVIQYHCEHMEQQKQTILEVKIQMYERMAECLAE